MLYNGWVVAVMDFKKGILILLTDMKEGVVENFRILTRNWVIKITNEGTLSIYPVFLNPEFLPASVHGILYLTYSILPTAGNKPELLDRLICWASVRLEGTQSADENVLGGIEVIHLLFPNKQSS